jgi:hypothetical protein
MAPTPTPGDNDTSIATTAFVTAAVAGSPAGIPEAPNDGTQYGRQSLSWTPIVGGGGGGGGGDVFGPVSAIADRIAVFNGPTGKVIKDGGTSIAEIAADLDSRVRYDAAQSKSAAQQEQARKNISAAPIDALAYNGMQINGSMEVNQAGIISTPTTGAYLVDGWQFFTSRPVNDITANVAATTAVAGFQNTIFVGVGVAAVSLAAGDYVTLVQKIEGYRTSRLAWGTANAQPITIGFWSWHVRPGWYSVSVRNKTANRSYISAYNHVANSTPQFNTITVPGDTGGTWAVDHTTGIEVAFCVACGTTFVAPSENTWLTGNYLGAAAQVNGVAATSDAFRITGVVVLPGNEAPPAARSPLIMRPFDQELMVCQRYYQKSYDYSVVPGTASQINGSHTVLAVSVYTLAYSSLRWWYKMGSTPTVLVYSPQDGASGFFADYNGADVFTANRAANFFQVSSGGCNAAALSGDFTVNTNKRVHWVASARLT